MPDKITPDPNPPLQTFGFTDGSLFANKDLLINNLWRLFFEWRMKYNSYTVSQIVTPQGPKVCVEKNNLFLNIPETTAINNISDLCKKEAEAIAYQLYAFIEAAKTPLKVDIGHAYSIEGHPASNYKDVVEGGGTPYGLEF